jgi:hypothetical protein
VAGVGVEVPEEVGEELEGVPEVEAGEDVLDDPSFFSLGVCSPVSPAGAPLPAGGLSLSE